MSQTMDLRKISTRNRDANSQFVHYDGWDVGYVVCSTDRGKWPYASQYVQGVDDAVPSPGKRYFPVIVEGSKGYRLPPHKDRWQAYRLLVAYHLGDADKKAHMREMCKTMRRMDDLRAQDPNHADLHALTEQMEKLADELQSRHGGV